MKTTFVFGAGADCGIFPLTNHLVSAINSYLETDSNGKKIHSLLKNKLGFSSFSYSSIMDNAAHSFIQKNDINKYEKLNQRLGQISIENLTDSQNQQLEFIKILTENLMKIPKKIRDKSKIDENTISYAEKLGILKMVTVYPETSINKFYKLSLQKLLRQYLLESSNKVLHTLFKSTVNLDEILLEYFLGFYNGNKVCMRRYEYLLWTMWAFFVDTEIKYYKNPQRRQTIYNLIGGCPVITLNYTTLVSHCPECPDLIHFHGSVLNYIDCQTREEKRIPSLRKIKSLEESINTNALEILKKDLLPLIEIHKGKSAAPDRCIIPSMMPPFEIKPIIANDLIDSWHHAFENLRNSKNIVVTGYSFNHTDSHFNDIILDFSGKKEKNGNWQKKIFIINPDKKSIITYFDGLEKLKTYPWKIKKISETEIETHTKANITLIPITSETLTQNYEKIKNFIEKK